MLSEIKNFFKRNPHRDHRCVYCDFLLMRQWAELAVKTKEKGGGKGIKHVISIILGDIYEETKK